MHSLNAVQIISYRQLRPIPLHTHAGWTHLHCEVAYLLHWMSVKCQSASVILLCYSECVVCVFCSLSMVCLCLGILQSEPKYAPPHTLFWNIPSYNFLPQHMRAHTDTHSPTAPYQKGTPSKIMHQYWFPFFHWSTDDVWQGDAAVSMRSLTLMMSVESWILGYCSSCDQETNSFTDTS